MDIWAIFWFAAVMKKAFMNTLVHAFWYTYGFIALGNTPRFGIAES